MLVRRLIRAFGKIEEKQLTEAGKKGASPVLRGVYQNVNAWFPRLVPRIVRFSWLDLVVFSEIFFVGLMVYIHFIDA